MCDHCGCRAYPPIAELTAEHVEILRLAEPLARQQDPARTNEFFGYRQSIWRTTSGPDHPWRIHANARPTGVLPSTTTAAPR